MSNLGDVAASGTTPPPRRRRGRPRKAALPQTSTRERLLEAAEETFAELGYDRVTLSEIARRAGLTTGSIYNNFPGKADLLIEVVQRVLAKFPPILASGAGESLSASMGTGTQAWFSVLSEADRRMLAEVHLAAAHDPDIADMLREMLDEAIKDTTDRFAAAQTTGEVHPDLDPRALAVVYTVWHAGLNLAGSIEPGVAEDQVVRSYLEQWAMRLVSIEPHPQQPPRRALRGRRTR